MDNSTNLPRSATQDTMWKSLESYKVRTGLSKAMIHGALEISKAVRFASDNGGDIERATLLLQMQSAFTKLCKGRPEDYRRLVEKETARIYDEVYIQKNLLNMD